MMAAILKAADRMRYRARLKSGSATAALGHYGEDLAQRYLQGCGLTVIARNHRLTNGSAEIDIVAREGDTLVFVEVKTRQTDEYGSPDRAIGVEKRRHMVRAALDYARRCGVNWQNLRFDIVSIVMSDAAAITHLRDVLPLRQ